MRNCNRIRTNGADFWKMSSSSRLGGGADAQNTCWFCADPYSRYYSCMSCVVLNFSIATCATRPWAGGCAATQDPRKIRARHVTWACGWRSPYCAFANKWRVILKSISNPPFSRRWEHFSKIGSVGNTYYYCPKSYKFPIGRAICRILFQGDSIRNSQPASQLGLAANGWGFVKLS